MSRYLLGQPITLSVAISVDGVATDPTALTLRIQLQPDGAVTEVHVGDLTHDGDGAYSYVYEPGEIGNYGYSWTSTGVAAGYSEAFFRVMAHRVDS